jgi:L-fuconolactonase
MTEIVDSHQHFWNYGTYQTSWMEKPPYAGDPIFESIRRSFGPADLEPELEAAGVCASITVQAADGAQENDILLKHAVLTPWIAGVVGWIPLDKPDEAAEMLEQFSREKLLVGVRHLINVEPDPDWILRGAVIEGLGILMDYNLTFDYVGILPRHLEHVPIWPSACPPYASSLITWANPQLPAADLSRGRRY